jgi:hypothetical protein
MATRFYCPASAETTPFTFSASSEWEVQTDIQRAVARTTPIGDAMTTVSFADANNQNRDVCFRQYQSYPLTVGQIITGSQAIKAQCRVSERYSGNNLFFTVGLRVFNKNSTINKVLLSPTRDNTEAAEGSLVNRQFTATSTTGSYTTVAGDYLVIEIGMGGDPAGADLAEDDSSTADNRPWVEITSTLTFAPYSATAAATTGAATFAGSASFTEAGSATYTATAALTTGTTAFSASAIAGQHAVGKITQPKFGIFSRRSTWSAKTLTPPTSYGTANLVTVAVDFAATASYTGLTGATGSITVTGMTFSGSGFHAASHSVTKLTQPTWGVFGQRYGSFASKGGTRTASAALEIGGVVFAASGTFHEMGAGPHPVGKITQPTWGVFGQRYGSFEFKGGLFTATAALTVGGVEFSATGAVSDPVYTATAVLTTGGADFAGTAAFATATRTATAALMTGNAEFSAVAEFSSGSRVGTAALTVGALTFSASASYTAPTRTATASLTTGAVQFSATDYPQAPTTAGIEYTLPKSQLHYTIPFGVT